MTRTHLLVTNDFPPKIGGIQSYLWELWRRLDPSTFTVLTSPHSGAVEWDAAQPFRVERIREPWLLPHPVMVHRVNALAEEIGADFVVIDPAVPLGIIGPRLRLPYGVVLHGAEVAIPARLPISRPILGHVLRGADLVIAAGGYPAAEAERAAGRQLPTVVVPPGVDTERFQPLDSEGRAKARATFGLPLDAPVITCVSRLVPRKGIDSLVRAAGRLVADFPDLVVAVAGSGRERGRLERLAAATGAPVRFLGRVPDDDLRSFYGCGDVFAMVCRTRWGGLEQEGFGIVFVEAAAAGVPQIAGASGGSADAVVHGETGLVVADPTDVAAVVDALRSLLRDPATRRAMSIAGRDRAVREFSYDVLAARLADALGSAVAHP